MANNWQECKNILCIRPDNMGDLLMTGPALRALKRSFDARITVLTSSMAAGIASLMPEIDEVFVFDLPWVKTSSTPDTAILYQVIEQLKQKQFDAAVIFTVYSQNPLPSVMLAYLAGIPKRLAYCRENPYQLLTDWVPDIEPYTVIKHQVRRDLDLVHSVDAYADNEKLILQTAESFKNVVKDKLLQSGVDLNAPWLIIHPGVSELKREYPKKNWIAAGKKIINELGYQMLITGTVSEKYLTEYLQKEIGIGGYSLGGLFSLNEFIALISMAPVIVSVNTGTVHIAAATGTPVVVLYALTNPQHTPWNVMSKVLPYQVPFGMHSKNEVIRHVNDFFYKEPVKMPDEIDVFNAVKELIAFSENRDSLMSTANLNCFEAILSPVPIPAENPVDPTS